MSTVFGRVRGAACGVSVALLLAGVTVGTAQAEEAGGEVVKVDAPRQTVEFDGGTAEFASQLTIGPTVGLSGRCSY